MDLQTLWYIASLIIHSLNHRMKISNTMSIHFVRRLCCWWYKYIRSCEPELAVKMVCVDSKLYFVVIIRYEMTRHFLLSYQNHPWINSKHFQSPKDNLQHSFHFYWWMEELIYLFLFRIGKKTRWKLWVFLISSVLIFLGLIWKWDV